MDTGRPDPKITFANVILVAIDDAYNYWEASEMERDLLDPPIFDKNLTHKLLEIYRDG